MFKVHVGLIHVLRIASKRRPGKKSGNVDLILGHRWKSLPRGRQPTCWWTGVLYHISSNNTNAGSFRLFFFSCGRNVTSWKHEADAVRQRMMKAKKVFQRDCCFVLIWNVNLLLFCPGKKCMLWSHYAAPRWKRDRKSILARGGLRSLQMILFLHNGWDRVQVQDKRMWVSVHSVKQAFDVFLEEPTVSSGVSFLFTSVLCQFRFIFLSNIARRLIIGNDEPARSFEKEKFGRIFFFSNEQAGSYKVLI